MLVPVAPARLVDTRPGTAHLLPVVDRPLRAGESVRLHVVGLTGRVPASGVGSVHLTITALNATAAGSVSAAPCGTVAAPPMLWFTALRPAANSTFVAPDGTGSVCVSVTAPTHLLVDLRGYTPATGGFHAVRPTHVFDTRSGHAALRAVPARPLAAGTVLKVRFTALGSVVPASGVRAFTIHVTATGATAAGSLTAWSCGTRPTAASLAYTTGTTTVTALVLAPDATGSLCFTTTSTVHVATDIIGWAPTTGSLRAVTATRVLDATVGTTPTSTRPGAAVGVAPAAVVAWSVRLSVLAPAGAGTAIVQACGGTTKLATLTFAAAQSTTVAVVLPAHATLGTLCVSASRAVRVRLDVDGWFAR